jgi:hypothetical protein
LTNGTYSEIDAEVIFEILPNLWGNVIINSIEKLNKTNENISRLRMIEKRLELGKTMTINLSNILKDDDDVISSKDLTRRKILSYKLKSMVNFLENTYGGMGFM